MTVIHLQDDPGDYNMHPAKVVVTQYKCGEWEGSGSALLWMCDGSVEEWGLGHCSCYGPWDGPLSAKRNSLDEFINEDNALASAAESDLRSAFIAACRKAT